MRSEALDITIQRRKGTTWLSLSGPFHDEQIPNIREKILSLIHDGNRRIAVNLEAVSDVDTSVPTMFLSLMNTMKIKGGEFFLVFKNESVSRAFVPFRSIFSIFPDEQSAEARGFAAALVRRVKLLFRRTGIRISRPVAFFLLFVLCGWFFSLIYIIRLQNIQIHKQTKMIRELSYSKQQAEIEVERLRERIRPLSQLGILNDDLQDTTRQSDNEYP